MAMCICLLMTVQSVLSQSTGGNDPTFNSIDIPDGFNESVLSIALQPDGKVIVGGNFTSYQSIPIDRIVRLNIDGTLDLTFNPGTGFNGAVHSIALQNDGKLIVGGEFTSYNNTARNRIIRLNSNGLIDTSFNPGNGFDKKVNVILSLADGKMIVGGEFVKVFNGSTRKGIACLNTDGSLNTNFGITIQENQFQIATVKTIVRQTDEKLIVGGDFGGLQGARKNLLRLNSDGTLDQTLDPGNTFVFAVTAMALQSDGKIIAGSQTGVTRHNTNGTLDTSFANGAIGGIGINISAIVLQTDGKPIIAAGGMVRLNVNGSIDYTFAHGVNNQIWTMVKQPDDKFIIGGDFTIFKSSNDNPTNKNRIARFSFNGTLDFGFSAGNGFNYTVRTLGLQPDGKVLVGGNFTTFNALSRNRIARMNTDGTLDDTFNPGTGFNTGETPIIILSLALQSDGKIIVGGFNFTNFNGTPRNTLARLNADGSLDSSFNPIISGGTTSSVFAVVVQSDGKIIIAGSAFTINGVVRKGVARLNDDGTPDAGFDAGAAVNGASALALQLDGKILVASNPPAPRILRLNTNGTVDSSFSSGTGFSGGILGGAVRTILVQPDGKILVGGNFTGYNGTARAGLARLNKNGTLDIEFNQGTIANNGLTVISLALQPDGKIILAGSFPSFNGTIKNHIGRINPIDGAHDTTFNTGSGFNSDVYALQLLPDNKIIAGGEFTQFNGTLRTRITRLITGVSSLSYPMATAATNLSQSGFTANWNAVTEATGYQLDVSTDTFKTFITGYVSKNITGTSESVTGLTSNTTYKYRVRAINSSGPSANSEVINVTTLSDSKQNQTIIFSVIPDKILGDAAFSLIAKASSTLPISFSTDSDKITITGSQVTIMKEGLATIRANQAGDAAFNAANFVDQIFCIKPVKPSITIINDDTATPTLNSSAPAGNQWFHDGNLIPGANSVSLLTQSMGVYSVQSKIDGCKSDMSSDFAVIITGMESGSYNNALKIYPNPADDRIVVVLPEYIRSYQLRIIAADSKTTKILTSESLTVELEVSTLPSGLYYIEVQNGISRFKAKFVKK